MLKKITTLLLIVVLLASFSACGETTYEFAGVEGGASASDLVVGNGNFIVQKGNYLYYINSAEATTAANDFGTQVAGALIRSDLAGSNRVIVQPKLVTNGASVGLWIFGERIYYTSPSIAVDKDGKVQTSYLDVMSCKLDGTDIKTIITLASTSRKLYFYDLNGKVFFAYVNSDDSSNVFVASVDTTADKPKATPIVENYTSVVFGSDAIFYSCNAYVDEGKKVPDLHDEIHSVLPDGSNDVKCVDGNAGSNIKFSYTLQKIADGRLYYTKNDAVLTQENSLNCRTVSGASLGNEEIRVSMTSFTAANFMPYTYNGEKGIVVSSSNYSTTFIGEKGTLQTIKNTASTMSFVDGDYLYYTTTTDSVISLYRLSIKEALDKKEALSGAQTLGLTVTMPSEEEGGEELSTTVYDKIYSSTFSTPVVLNGILYYYTANESQLKQLYAYDLATSTSRLMSFNMEVTTPSAE